MKIKEQLKMDAVKEQNYGTAFYPEESSFKRGFDAGWDAAISQPNIYVKQSPIPKGTVTQYLGVYVRDWKEELGEPECGFLAIDESEEFNKAELPEVK